MFYIESDNAAFNFFNLADSHRLFFLFRCLLDRCSGWFLLLRMTTIVHFCLFLLNNTNSAPIPPDNIEFPLNLDDFELIIKDIFLNGPSIIMQLDIGVMVFIDFENVGPNFSQFFLHLFYPLFLPLNISHQLFLTRIDIVLSKHQFIDDRTLRILSLTLPQQVLQYLCWSYWVTFSVFMISVFHCAFDSQ